jgi:hypothetical protein
MYAFGLGKLPWYLEVLFGICLTIQGLRFWASLIWGFVRGILHALPDDLVIKTLRLALIYLPQIWRGIVEAAQGTKELISQLPQALMSLLFIRKKEYRRLTYVPLHAGEEISLLCLSGKFWGLELQGKLVRSHIKNLPPYECISHRWGDSTEEMTLVLEGRKLKVSTNVHSVLREKRAFFKSRLIWIDSVCINQVDPKEKSHQVRKMQAIYAKATRVTVCLGDSPDAHLARALIVKLYSFIVMFNPKDWTERIVSIYITSQKVNDWNKPLEWLALKKMLRNPWFERR